MSLIPPAPPNILQVTVYTVDNSSALLERLESLQTRIIEGNVRLIILDSVAALARRVRTRADDGIGSAHDSIVFLVRYIHSRFFFSRVSTSAISCMSLIFFL